MSFAFLRWTNAFKFVTIYPKGCVFMDTKKSNVSFPTDNDLKIQNAETIAAMLESERIMNDPIVKAYDVDDALKELKK